MKYALVTGASSGIGKSICVKLASDLGYHVLVNYLHNQEEAHDTVKQVEAKGGTAEIMQFDVTSFSDTEKKLNAWAEKNKQAVIEVLVNNAGLVKDGLFMFMDAASWSEVIDVKLKGFYNVTRCVIQKMILNKHGRIINIASLAGLSGNAGQVNYAAANGGLIAATKALAKEIGKKNVTVNAVAPGFINTEMTDKLDYEKFVKIIPANRFGTAEEVADMVSFLASPKASYITGAVININGGIY